MENLNELVNEECVKKECHFSHHGVWNEFQNKIESQGYKTIILDSGFGQTDFVIIDPKTFTAVWL